MSGNLLELQDISKSFPGVRALEKVSLRVEPGEVHALVGENGAGKSTLLNVLSGVYHADSGTIRIAGRPVHIPNPKAAQRAGISMIHQELQQVPELTVAQNLFLGTPPRRFGLFTDNTKMRLEARRVLSGLDKTIDVSAPLKRLSVAQRQIIEIARALLRKARVLAMDEPTSSLTPKEFERLVVIIQELSKNGVSVVYASHKFDEIRRICRRATVLRDGRLIGTAELHLVDDQQLVRMLVGRTLESCVHTSHVRSKDVVLRVEKLRWKNSVRDVSFELRRGEILGVAGLIGSGRTEMARLIAGLEKPDEGVVEVKGHRSSHRTRREAIQQGIGLLPEDRKREGIVPQRAIFLNVALPNLNRFSRFQLIRFGALREEVTRLTRQMNLRPPDVNRQIRLFSGGNQQKALICRWLYARTDILIFDEPTRGIDVGAKQEIYQLLEGLAAAGNAIIAISSELPEIIRISDRVLVMRAGSEPVFLKRGELNEENIVRHAIQRQLKA
jgi:ribose transport system ATP-binding protein